MADYREKGTGFHGVIEKLLHAGAEALDELVKDEADAIRDDISVPVQYGPEHVEFARADGSQVEFWATNQAIVRSKPGEPPRKETGELYDSIDHYTQIESDKVVAQVSAGPAKAEDGTDYSEILEKELNRPYMITAWERFAPRVLPAVAARLSEALR